MTEPRVLLVQPKEGNKSIMKAVYRPLTLEILAAYLDDCATDIFDMRVDDRDILEKIEDFRPTVIAVTSPFTITVPVVTELARHIKKAFPDILIVVGGVHPSLIPEDFEDSGVDVIVRGPGEHMLRKVVEARASRRPLGEIESLYIRNGEGFRYTGDTSEPYSLENFRLPARHLTKKYASRYPTSPKGQTLSLTITSRGCPNRCSFCAAWKVQGGKFMMRTVDNIVSEIEQTEEEMIYLFDDNSFANPGKMMKLARTLQERGVRKEYQMWASADIIARREDLVEEWVKAGLRRLFVGFESFDDSRLREYKKKATVAVNEKAHDILKTHGVDLSPTFIVNYDFSDRDFERLHEYLEERDFFMPYPFIYTPLPGTELWDIHKDEIVTRDYECFDLFHLTLQPQNMEPDRFLERFADLYLENSSWKFMEEKSPVVAQILEGVRNLKSAA